MLKGHELAPAWQHPSSSQAGAGQADACAHGALALIQNSPLIEKVMINDLTDDKGNPIGCEVTMKRTNGFEYTTRFTIKDAERAGLVSRTPVGEIPCEHVQMAGNRVLCRCGLPRCVGRSETG